MKSGDFKTEKSSIVASKDAVASEHLKIKSSPGCGGGEAKLWHNQQAGSAAQTPSASVAKGDSRTKQGSVYAAKEVRVGRCLGVQALCKHGLGMGACGNAQLWHGRGEEAEGAIMASTSCLEGESFQTQKVPIIAHKDMFVGRCVKIGAPPGVGLGSAQSWYSGAGTCTRCTYSMQSPSP